MLQQGNTQPWAERIPMPAADAMSPDQRAAAQALIDGPRKAVFGPFLPLLQSPQLMERIGSTGEYLRFDSRIDPRVRELVTCVVARHTHNQFEWAIHAPAAVKAGVSAEAIEALRLGRRAAPLAEDEQLAVDFALELLQHHGVSEPTWRAADARFGARTVVELSALIGYFAMVCWVMNVAHTPVKAAEGQAGLDSFPL
jgi:4-carboxymuconolactone decarboxylase